MFLKQQFSDAVKFIFATMQVSMRLKSLVIVRTEVRS